MGSLYDVYVPAEGNENADIMIVGESPGKEEAQKERPFVGRSGKQFNQWLKQVGLKREDLWITNSVKYMPKGKKEKYFFESSGVPTNEYLDGIAELTREIRKVEPNVIVPMGNYALWALTQQTGIMKWRGSIMESKLIEGYKVIPTLHPAYILRQWKEHPLFIWDFQRIKEESKDKNITRAAHDYIIHPTSNQISEAVSRALEADIIAIDTEWFSPDDLSCLGFTTDSSWAICIPSHYPEAIPVFRSILGSNARKIFQNAMFDCTYLERAGLPVKIEDDEGNSLVEDTMVAHYVTWPDLKKGLDTIASVYTKEPYYKDDYKIAKAGDQVDLDLYYTYNCKDVRVTFEAWEALQDEMDNFKTEKAYQLNMLSFPMMKEASITGINCNYSTLIKLQKEHEAKADEMQARLNDVVQREINVRSYPQMRELVYDALGVPEKKGRPTDQATLMDIAAQTKEDVVRSLLTLIIKLREERNVVSKYINLNLPDEDGRIRSSWNIAGTKNGRLSCTKDHFKGTGAALNTFPYEARKVCIADPGYLFLKPDQAQAEARIVAYLSNDIKTLEWLEQGLDIHCKMVELIYGIPYEEARAAHKAMKGGQQEPKRFICKTSKHATNYMMGVILLRLTVNKDFHETLVGIDTKESRRIRQIILESHPLEAWWREVEREVGKGRYLINPFGRKRMFTDRWGSTMFKDAIAFVPQSTASDINKMGLSAVRKYIKKEWPDDPYVAVLADLHDGSLIQIPEEGYEKHLKPIVDLLTIPVRIKGQQVTIPIEMAVGHCWGEMEEVEL